MKELEMELEQMGLYDSDFNLGDVLDEPEDDQKPATDPQKRRLPDFPQVEGEETVVEYVGQYKKACLTRKALLKTTKERLDRDKAQGYETLGLKCVSQNYMCTWNIFHKISSNTWFMGIPSLFRKDLEAMEKAAGPLLQLILECIHAHVYI